MSTTISKSATDSLRILAEKMVERGSFEEQVENMPGFKLVRETGSGETPKALTTSYQFDLVSGSTFYLVQVAD